MRGIVSYVCSQFWLICTIVVIAACQSQADKPQVVSLNKFDDTTIVRIYELRDQRDGRSLMGYLNHEESLYRKEAAMALGSVQDSSALPMLALLLNDASPQVRRAAAFALGQLYDSSAVKPLMKGISGEDSLIVRRELYESLGKVVTQPQIHILYQLPDEHDMEKEGLARALYRAGIRNVHDPAGVSLAVAYLSPNNSYETRLAAAHFLGRTRNISFEQYEKAIVKAAKEDPAPYVRMMAVLALGKIDSPSASRALTTSATSDPDYRVRVNSLRALSSSAQIAPEAIAGVVNDSNTHVSIAAAHLVSNIATTEEEVMRLVPDSGSAHVRAILMGGALKLAGEKQELIRRVSENYEAAEDPYEKAAYLTALGNTLQAHEFIITKTFSGEHPAISTAGITALIALRSRTDFPDLLKPTFADIFVEAVETGDVAMIAVVSAFLSNPEYDIKSEFDSIGFLHTAKGKLSLPRDNETLQALNAAIARFEEKELPGVKNEYNHPIDWQLVKNISRDQQVRVKTEKGDVVLRLFVEEAPGSVANFVKLAQDNYFDKKNFHRVVPNFVIQGGCHRGDGYGSEDYSIRSDFSYLRYQEGSVGMASAGKDTEGTQWFVTHSPTPHLDGRYSIFAQVTEGMGVVHQIEEGDRIISIELIEKDKQLPSERF